MRRLRSGNTTVWQLRGACGPRLGWLAVMAVALLAAGCRPATTCQIAGTVTVDGKPVGRGFVSFCRLDKVQQPCEVRIVNGRFDVDARSLLGPGRYLVQCTAESPDAKHLPPEYDGTVTPGAKPPEDFKPENRPYLSDAWHSKSTLEVTLVLGSNRVDIAGPRDGAPSPRDR